MENKSSTYIEGIHRSGRRWCLFIFCLLLLVPIMVCILFGTRPDMQGLIGGLIATAPMYYAVSFVEVFTYFPMLGPGGSYLSFVTGNISNLKLPCAINALESTGVEANSEEGDVISTIAIAVSSIVTMVIIMIGVVLIVTFVSPVSPAVYAAVDAETLPSDPEAA